MLGIGQAIHGGTTWPRRALSTIVIAFLAAFATFLVMTATRPEPRVRAVGLNGSLLPGTPLDHLVVRLNLINAPLQDAIRSVSRETGVPIRMNTETLAGARVPVDSPVTVQMAGTTLGRALSEILSSVKTDTKLDFWVDDDSIEISTHDDEETHVVTKVYDVAEILKSFAEQGRDFWRSPSGFVTESAPAIQPGSPGLTLDEAQAALEKLVSDNVATQTWKFNGGSAGELRCAFGRLIVTQTPRNQDAVEALLFVLAKPQSLKAPPEGIMLPDRSLRWPATQ